LAQAVCSDLFAYGSNLAARFVRLLLRLSSPFLKSQIVLILFRQENRGYREGIVGAVVARVWFGHLLVIVLRHGVHFESNLSRNSSSIPRLS
jgi:hypothetical protein